jgi:addiction module HigA family antidote
MNNDPLRSVHPGEILREEYLRPLSLSAGSLAIALHVPRTRIERLSREETPVTPDTALRLARYFGGTAEFWLGIQAQYDLEVLRHDLAPVLSEITQRSAA